MTSDRGWIEYGAEFLRVLADDHDWRTVEALWRWGGSSADLHSVADVMAESGDRGLSELLGEELLIARYAALVPTLPNLVHASGSRVSADMAERILLWLEDDDAPPAGGYVENAAVLFSWLLGQPGEAIDALAVKIALGDHRFADVDAVLRPALVRVAASADLSSQVVSGFSTKAESWGTGAGWTRTAQVVSQIGQHGRGRADLVRTLTRDFLKLPPVESAVLPPEFEQLVEKHATAELRSAFDGAPLAETPSTTAAVRLVSKLKPAVRDDLIEVLGGHQPALWTALRTEIVAAWTTDDWQRMLDRWSVEGSKLFEPEVVLGLAPPELVLPKVRAAVVHGSSPNDGPSRVAEAALKTLVLTEHGPPVDADAIAGDLPWDLITSPERLEYVRFLLENGLAPEMACTAVMGAYSSRRLSSEHAAELVPRGQYGEAFKHLASGPLRTALARAMYPLFTENAGAVFESIVQADPRPLDLVEAIAPLDAAAAFGTFDTARWHALETVDKDQLLEQLEAHATVAQAELLDVIARDSDGTNTDRRARAALRWSGLTYLHSEIPPGVLSLLESAQPKLAEVFAEIAAKVQPRDDVTLARLKHKWLAGGRSGEAARGALDTVAAGVVDSLTGLRSLERWDQGPGLLQLLGLTSATNSFATLLAYVGADAVDDNLQLRQAAAEGISVFVEATKLDSDQLEALGARLASETDPIAGDHLRAALAAAKLGDDAAILGLYQLTDIDPPTQTPDELFGLQKKRLLTALKNMYTQKALGPPGWAGYVQEMDLVAEALVRTAYLRFGSVQSLRDQVSKGQHNRPEYGNLLGSLRSTEGFTPIVAHLETVHEVRKTRTSAHHPIDGPLDDKTVGQCENALKLASREILERLIQDQPVLRAVPAPS